MSEGEAICTDCGGELNVIDTIYRKSTGEVVSEVLVCEVCESMFSDRGRGLEPGEVFGVY